MKVIQAPKLQFKCTACGALNEGEENEFRPQHTMPPSFLANCGYCQIEQRVFPQALLAKAAGQFFP